MKKYILIGFWASAGLLGFACGDSDEPSGDSSGGASNTGGSAGSTNGGAAGSGATGGSSGAGVTGGAAGSAGGPMGGSAGSGAEGGVGADGGVGAEGGMGDGGETTTGGSAGSGGGGMGGSAGGGSGGGGAGSGGAPNMGCPMNQPMPMSMCMTRGLSCDFGDTICRCNLGNGNWNCFDQNDDCPAMPDPGGNCTGGQTACSYGNDGTCVCIQGDFTCDDGVVACPATRPTDGASCTMFPAGFDCPYAAGDCSCGAGAARTWNCEGGGGMCPAMAPDTGDPCMNPGTICEFNTPGPGADETCVCNTTNAWTCL